MSLVVEVFLWHRNPVLDEDPNAPDHAFYSDCPRRFRLQSGFPFNEYAAKFIKGRPLSAVVLPLGWEFRAGSYNGTVYLEVFPSESNNELI